MNTRIPIGIVGLNFGRHIVRDLTQGPAAELFQVAAVCDRDAARAEAIGQEIGVPPLTDIDELLADAAIPAIGIFTSPVGRAALIRRCLEAGKDVITTKPLENDPLAALEVLEAAERMGRTLHLNSPVPVLPSDLAQIVAWQEEFSLGAPVACRADVWVSYREQEDDTWYDDPTQCPVAPIFRLGIYLINDLVRLFGHAERVQVLHSRLFTARPTPDNAQLGILFRNGALANIFASFCVNDGDEYRNSLTLNYENGTIYRNTGPHRAGHACELSLVVNGEGGRTVAAATSVLETSGQYQWDVFARAVRGEKPANTISPRDIVAGLQIIEAMARADAGDGWAAVRSVR